LVDDEISVLTTLKMALTAFSYVVDTASNAEEALLLFNPAVHDLVITDNSMPGMSGLELAHAIKLRSATTPVVMHTGRLPDERSCLDLVIQKPGNLFAMGEAIGKLVAKRRPDKAARQSEPGV